MGVIYKKAAVFIPRLFDGNLLFENEELVAQEVPDESDAGRGDLTKVEP